MSFSNVFLLWILFIVSRHRTLMNVYDKSPVVDKDVFVAPSASVIGDVQVGRASSIWYGCVLRGNRCLNFGLVFMFRLQPVYIYDRMSQLLRIDFHFL